MDTVIWVLIVLLIVAAGGGVLLARGGALASGPFASWRESTRLGERTATPRAMDTIAAEPRQLSPAEVIDLPVMAGPERKRVPAGEHKPSLKSSRFGDEAGEARSGLNPFDPSSDAAPGADSATRIEHLESRIDELEREVLRHLQVVQEAVAAGAGETRAELTRGQERHIATLDQFRAEITAQLAREPDMSTLLERRIDAAAELYTLLARFELAVAQATNPVLLPGEPYTPPGDFPIEALVWESWKDAGERAFALAEGFSIQRIYLTEPARTHLAAFITLLRGLLTRSVYPNLGPHPTADETGELRTALLGLATELPKVRRVLEAELAAAVPAKS